MPVYVSTIMMDLHTPLPPTRPACLCRTRNDGFSICQEQRGLRGILAAKVFCHGGDGETEILPRCHVQCNGITSEAWGDTTVYQSFPGYLPPAFHSRRLWGQGRQRELLGLDWVEVGTTRLRSRRGLELFPEPHRFSIKTPEKCDNASLPTSQSILRC